MTSDVRDRCRSDRFQEEKSALATGRSLSLAPEQEKICIQVSL
jgi:hypothetical protein